MQERARARIFNVFNHSTLPRFYLHEEGVFNFTPALKCWHRSA